MAEINESEILARCIPFKSYNNRIFKNHKIDPITLKLYKNNKAIPLKKDSNKSSTLMYLTSDVNYDQVKVCLGPLQKGKYNNCENYLEKVEEYNQFAEIIKSQFGKYAHNRPLMIPE
ncbi:Hypothetical_protein [Hexamita inflata]|uniref:Hypothetical_protein n=1 Tax=Hexamita inflata TaxID=28002 RepID=A0AA86RED9_9EUKA|nr:Hypothetical protein HINF_LOCUS60823 [Hexamita inflata]